LWFKLDTSHSLLCKNFLPAASVLEGLGRLGTFKTDRAAFRILALDLIVRESSSAHLVQLRDLSIPMLEKLLERPQVIPSSVLFFIGGSIPRGQQEKLFAQLAVITANEIELPITIRRLEVKRPQSDITEHETGRENGVFRGFVPP
jgi:hypothetical protein